MSLWRYASPLHATTRPDSGCASKVVKTLDIQILDMEILDIKIPDIEILEIKILNIKILDIAEIDEMCTLMVIKSLVFQTLCILC